MRLPFWSRRAPDERRHAIATLQSLGTTSVAGLAAALSWSVPRTERVLQELVRHGPRGLVYDSRSGTIHWGSPGPSAPRPTPPQPPLPTPNGSWAASTARATARPAPGPVAVPAPSRAETISRPPPPGPTRAAPAVVPSDYTLRECARCQTPLVPTGTADEFACPMCGRRVTGTGARISSAPARPPESPGPDPRIQQLIAAWATGQPAPCPHCRQPLRHTADGEFRCGSCGARISYGPTPATAPAAPAAGPTP